MRKSAISWSAEVMLAALSRGVFVLLCRPHRPDSSTKGDVTVASGAMDGLEDQWKGCEGKAGRERGGGGRGVSQHAAPLGRWAMTSKALPPPYSHLRNMLLG